MTGAIKEKLTLSSGAQPHEGAGHAIRLGSEDERAVKESAAEKAAAVYFDEKDRLAKEVAAQRVNVCVEKCAEKGKM